MDHNKIKLVEQLTTYIKELPDTALITNESTMDLFSLFKELCAIKTEMKQSTRQIKTAMDDFREVFQTLQKSHETLNKTLAQTEAAHTESLQQQRQTVLKPIIIDLIDLHDRLSLAHLHAENYCPTGLMKYHKNTREFITSLSEGQHITLRRLEQLLQQYNVQPISALNQKFDPETMRAVAIGSQPDIANGLVIEELRKGFLWEKSVLRFTEVKVNKWENEHEPTNE